MAHAFSAPQRKLCHRSRSMRQCIIYVHDSRAESMYIISSLAKGSAQLIFSIEDEEEEANKKLDAVESWKIRSGKRVSNVTCVRRNNCMSAINQCRNCVRLLTQPSPWPLAICVFIHSFFIFYSQLHLLSIIPKNKQI